MQREKLPERLKEVATRYATSHREARDATNAANRIKTELRNAIKDYWQAEKLPIGSYIHAGGFEFRYEANETTELDAAVVLDMYEKGEISKEKFLQMISISRSEAKNILGADVVADLEVTTVGNKMDVRIESLPIENVDDEFVAIVRTVRKKIKRSVFGKAAAEREASTQPKQSIASGKRRIKTGKKK